MSEERTFGSGMIFVRRGGGPARPVCSAWERLRDGDWRSRGGKRSLDAESRSSSRASRESRTGVTRASWCALLPSARNLLTARATPAERKRGRPLAARRSPALFRTGRARRRSRAASPALLRAPARHPSRLASGGGLRLPTCPLHHRCVAPRRPARSPRPSFGVFERAHGVQAERPDVDATTPAASCRAVLPRERRLRRSCGAARRAPTAAKRASISAGSPPCFQHPRDDVQVASRMRLA